MLAYKIQMPGNYPEESTQHSEHGQSLKSRNALLLFQNSPKLRFFPHVARMENVFVIVTKPG
jgi:hypothetical protein